MQKKGKQNMHIEKKAKVEAAREIEESKKAELLQKKEVQKKFVAL